MIIDACDLADDLIDFTDYDRDKDGFIDCVYVFYAGEGEATDGGEDTVWPHSWQITAVDKSTKHIYDGVQLDYYACGNEWVDGGSESIGTFVHEFSHVMGLPDLYCTSSASVFSPGKWSVMDYGLYLNDGKTPPYYTAFERLAMGWIIPVELTDPADITLKPISENEARIIRTDNEYEYFLLENRQQEGWDSYLPHHGMLVWHIDFDKGVWVDNEVNNQRRHQRVDILEADNRQSDFTVTGDPFPGDNDVSSLTATTTPSLTSWAGEDLGASITEITETDGVIAFKFNGGAAAVGEIIGDISYSIKGNQVILEGLSEGERVEAFNVAGMMVSQAYTNSRGHAELTVPAKGIYILRFGKESLKIAL